MSQSQAKTQIHIHAKDINSLSGQTLVVFAKSNTDKSKSTKITHSETAQALKEALDEKTITGASGEILSFREARFLGFRNVICVGLGSDKMLSSEGVRQTAASLFKEIKNIKSNEVFVNFDGVSQSKKNMTEYVCLCRRSYTRILFF